jgi:PhzF family phenazine biosynthesis protein
MQLIARELRHSETAFLLTSDDSDVRIRYFTPTVEVPICGHATVAAHYVRANVLGLGNSTVWQTSLAGRHRVDIEATGNDYRISLEQGVPGFEPPLEGAIRGAIIDALHLSEDDMLAGLPIQVATTGHSKVMIPLKPEVDLDALFPELQALTAISQQIGCNGFFPFQIRPGENATDGRMFSPAIGIVEDPVTGNANGPMGAWLVHHGLMAHDGKTLRVQGHQGRALGRDGIVDVTVTIRDNQPEKVTITGSAVILFHAEWTIDF